MWVNIGERQQFLELAKVFEKPDLAPYDFGGFVVLDTLYGLFKSDGYQVNAFHDHVVWIQYACLQISP